MEKIRLQKYFTDCGILSRRKAEEEIAAGKVTVNGVTATVGDKIAPAHDVVLYNGKPIRPAHKNEHIYIMLHKPRGYLTAMTDDRGRKCVSELVRGVGRRVYPVGRLDLNSEGLLLLTDDGEIANILTHPRGGIPKLYNVTVRGEITDEILEKLRQPTEIDGYRTQGAEVECYEKYEGGGKLKIVLYEGRNREIRKMCEQVGIAVSRLCRVQIGEIKLDAIGLGKWRYLSESQISYLRSIKPKK